MAICNPITDKNCDSLHGYQSPIENSVARTSNIISVVIGIFLILGSIYFIIYFITAGLAFISSSGDDKKLAAAKLQLTNSIIGIVIILSVYAILSLIGQIFDINLITLTLPQLIK